MNDALAVVGAWVMGLLLGGVFFGGLWWTVRKGVSSKTPGLLFLGSMLLRMGVTLGGFYLVGHGHWPRLLVCLCGFVTARVVVTWMTRLTPMRELHPLQEAGHATDSR